MVGHALNAEGAQLTVARLPGGDVNGYVYVNGVAVATVPGKTTSMLLRNLASLAEQTEK